MLKRILVMSLSVMAFAACEQEVASFDGMENVSVEEISVEALPTSSQDYISDNFEGELVTIAYKVSSSEEATVYEAFLTNDMNLVFAADGSLEGFGEDASRVDCAGRAHRRHHRHHGQDGQRPPRPEEIEFSALPASAADYIMTNYADEEVLKVLLIDNEQRSGYHVLIKEVGAVVFDLDGNFVTLLERPERECGDFERVEVEDLPAAVLDYIATNYPDNEIEKARMGTRNEIVEIHVLVRGVGALIFSEDGVFIELKTCGMNHQG